MKTLQKGLLKLEEIQIEVTRKKMKTIRLKVCPPDGQVKISSPISVGDQVLKEFALSRLDWIRKQKQQITGQERWSPREYISGETHYYRGRPYQLQVYAGRRPPPPLIVEQDLILPVPIGSNRKKRQKILQEWYRRQLKNHLPGLLDKWLPRINVEPTFWGIKRMTTRWGSCNVQDRRIWLNLELAKRADHLLEYVLVHELVHLLEPSHNWRFKDLMTHFLPSWRACKEQLKRFPPERG